MSSRETRILLAVDDRIDYDGVRAVLPIGAPVKVTTLEDSTARISAILAEAPVDIVIIGCAEYTDRALRAIETAVRERPDTPVVALYAGTPNGFMEAAFDYGADDLITLPQSAKDVAFALEKVIARRRRAANTAGAAPMITVLGPKGGTGKTLTSCNLAVALALQGATPVLVDLDLQFGDVGLSLGVKPARTIYDLATSAGSLDGDKVESFMTMHSSGVRALLAPTRPDQAAAIKVPFLHELFEILRSRYDFVIVDTPPFFSPEVIASIDSSSQLCVVGMLDALSLKDTKIGLETLEQMGYDPAETALVLNRADTNIGISNADVQHLLGRTPDVLVPSDVAIPRSITEGRSIVEASPKSRAATAFTDLGRRYIDGQVATADAADTSAPRRRRSLLRKGR
jgi:pilus assembly protein CpaE